MADTASISERVIHHLIEASDLDVEAGDVSPATSLRDDLEIGSLQALTLIMDLEEEFEIAVEDEEFEGLQTVGDVIALLEAKQQ